MTGILGNVGHWWPVTVMWEVELVKLLVTGSYRWIVGKPDTSQWITNVYILLGVCSSRVGAKTNVGNRSPVTNIGQVHQPCRTAFTNVQHGKTIK